MSTPKEQTLGPLPMDVTVAGDQRFARHREWSHARLAVRLRVSRERQEPPQARQTLEKKKIQEENCREHRTVH